MKKQTTTTKPGAHARLLKSTFTAGLLPALILLLSIQASQAGSATWKASPTTNNWNTAGNWSPATVPNGPSDTATFATSSKTSVSFSAATEVNGITFNSGASAFTISVAGTLLPLTISGVGITNTSGITQNFVTAGDGAGNYAYMQFLNSATAGSSTRFTITNYAFLYFYNASTAGGGTFALNGDPTTGYYSSIQFLDSSSAGNGSFTLNAPAYIQFYGTSTAGNGTFTLNTDPGNYASEIDFIDTSTAGNGIFTLKGATVSSFGSKVSIGVNATAGNGTFTINGPVVSGGFGAQMIIQGSAGTATLIADAGAGGGYGGLVSLESDSLGGTSRVEVFGNGTGDYTDGNLLIANHTPPGVTIGSLEGSGSVFLGANKLTVGANNRSTTFSGVITAGPNGGTGGSLSKIGKGKLSLTKANTYTEGTTISKGALLAKNKTGSATGTGPVQVNAGTLGGTGKITGAVTIGTGSGIGAFLSPGNSAIKPGTLTITNNTLTFNSDSTYKCALDRTVPKATQVAAKGVTINSAAQFAFTDLGTATLIGGTVFTVINNTSAAAIAGTFSNLADGSTFTSTGGTTFQASYTGGTGNDLTLTVQ